MSSIEIIEKVKNEQGVREGNVLRSNLSLANLRPGTVTENSATLRGIVKRFYSPAFFDQEIELFFSYNEISSSSTKTVKADTIFGSVDRKFVSADISGLTRNTKYEFYLFAKVGDNVVTSKPPAKFKTGVFQIKTLSPSNIGQEQVTLNGKLSQFEGLIFEESGPFDVKTDSGGINFENQQNSESPLFVLNEFSNQDVQTSINTKNEKLGFELSENANVSLPESVSLEVFYNSETLEFVPESFDFESEITRDIRAGFEYKKVSENEYKDAFTVSPPSEAGDTFEKTISLDPNSDYEFRAFGTIGSFERIYGETKTFSTLEKEIVELETEDFSAVGVSNATVEGEVTNIEPAGTEIDVGFNYGVSVKNKRSSLQFTDSPTSFSQSLSSLEAGTTYEYQAYASSQNNEYTGPVKTFTTEAVVPETLPQSTNTDPSKDPTEGTAIFFGEILDLNPDADNANVQFQYGKEEPLSLTVDAGSKSQNDGVFETTVQSLDAGSEYKYRLKATDPLTGETETGSIETVETKNIEVVTLSATSVKKTSADLVGDVSVLKTSGNFTAYFEYREKGTTGFTSTSEQSFMSKTTYTESLSSLTEGTVYEYRAVIEKNSATVKGEIKEFQTKSVEIATSSASNVKTGSADFAGDLTFISSGVSEVEVYFDFREQGLTNETRVFADNSPLSSTGTFSASVTGLNADTTYEYRALADPDGAREQSANFQTFTTNNLEISTANIPSSRTETSITIGGEILAYGGDFATEDITVGHQYIRRGSGSIDISGTEKISSSSPVSSLTTFETTITGLQNGTKYNVRAFARVGGTTVFGKLQRVSTNLN